MAVNEMGKSGISTFFSWLKIGNSETLRELRRSSNGHKCKSRRRKMENMGTQREHLMFCFGAGGRAMGKL